jgi:chromosome segregation ATPase
MSSATLEKTTKLNLSEIKSMIEKIEKMPDIHSDIAAHLAEHIEALKKVSNDWLTQAEPQVAQGLSQASKLVIEWNNTYAGELSSSDKDRIKQTLKEISQESAAAQDALAKSSTITKNCDCRLATSFASIKADFTLIQTKLKADQASINDLNNRIASAQSKLNAYHKRARIYRWIPIAGWLADAIDSLASNISGYHHQISAYENAKNEDQQEINQISSFINILSNQIDVMRTLIAAFVSVEQSLDSLGSNVNDIMGQLDSIKDNMFPQWMQAQIQTLKLDFEQVKSITDKVSQ